MFRLADSSVGHLESKAPGPTPDQMNLAYSLYGMKHLPSPKGSPNTESCLKLSLNTGPKKHNNQEVFHYPGETATNTPWGAAPPHAGCQTSLVSSGGAATRPQSSCGAPADEQLNSLEGFEAGRTAVSPLEKHHILGQYTELSKTKMEKKPGEV